MCGHGRRRRAPYTNMAEMLEKTLARPLDCTEIQPVHPKADQSWAKTLPPDKHKTTAASRIASVCFILGFFIDESPQ